MRVQEAGVADSVSAVRQGLDRTNPPPQALPAPLHIALVNLTAGGMSEGYAKYLKHVVPLLRADPRVARLDLMMPAGLPAPDAGNLWQWETGRVGARARLRRRIQDLRPDVVFFPTARTVDCGAVPMVVMVRNMEPLRVPTGGNTPVDMIRNLARARAARSACRRASRIIAVSEHVKDFLANRWHLASEQIGVVHHGVERPPQIRRRPAPLAESTPFILTAGSIRPARGLEDVIEALPRVGQRQSGVHLAIAGRSDDRWRRYERRLRQRAHDLGVAGTIVWLGHLPPDELSWAYDRCAAFVVTSRAEACPNVVLEAMAHGAPCVAIDEEPMPELLGPAALYYPLGQSVLLSDRLCELVASPMRSAELAAMAAARAREFTWARTVEKTIDELAAAAHPHAIRSGARHP